MPTGEASITAASMFLDSCNSNWRFSIDSAMRLNASARSPTSSRVLTMLRWARLPLANASASRASCCKGPTIRPDSIQAIAKPAKKEIPVNAPPQVTSAPSIALFCSPRNWLHSQRR
jgi:hypothetical protein